MMTQQKEIVDLFLCHNGADKDWVRRLGEQIESETFDGESTGRPLRVFFDEWDINVGQNVPVRLNMALTASRYVAVIISPEMLSAPWPTFEWTHLVADDPTNRKGRIIPVFLRDYSFDTETYAELPAPFKALNWIDFRSPSAFNRSFQKLIRKVRDQPPARGKRRRPIALARDREPLPLYKPSEESAAAPDRVSDFVLSNLLPVEKYPRTIWLAPTHAREPNDVRNQAGDCVPFILQEKKLLTFSDLSIEGDPLRAVVDTSKIKAQPVGEWRDDVVRWRWIVSLFNKCLKSHFRGLPIRRDEKGRYFFLPKNGEARRWKNGKDPERTVADQKANAKGEVFWVHHSARLAFQTLGEAIFLCIEPSYVFTTDGIQPLEGKSVGPLSIKWGGKERNAAILRHVLFWGRTLSKGATKIEIETGGLPISLSGIPAFARTSFGIEFDHIGIGTLIDQAEDELALAADALSSALESDESEYED